MVCKEEVFTWFKELTGSKRIGVMCGLLNMCYPLELRFFGTCLEDLGKKDFYCFQDAEQKANNVNEVKKLTDLKDNVTRCKFIVSLALLHSSNHVCSNVLYQTLTKHLERFDLFSEDKTSNEMMLVLTMALNHPAFTFDQKTVLTQHLSTVEKLLGEANQTNHESHTWRRCASAVIPDSIQQATVSACQNNSPVAGITTSVNVTSVAHTITSSAATTSSIPCHHHHQVSFRTNDVTNQARISSLKYKGTHKRRAYRIRVSWTNGKYTEVSKTCHEIVVFHQKLLQLFPQEVFSNGQEKYIPPLPGIIAGQCEEITEESISALNDFLRQLTMHLPVSILESEHVTSFFKSPLYGRGGIRGGKYFPNDSFTEDGVRVPSITIYNSHRADGSSRSKNNMQHISSQSNHGSPAECSSGQQQMSTPPARSPVSSPVSSPYISPPPSGTSSRSASPWIQRPVRSVAEEKNNLGLEQLLRREHLLEYWEKLKPYKLEELQGMGQDKFEHIGISKQASTKLRKLLDNIRFSRLYKHHTFSPLHQLRSCSGQNGVKSLLPVIQSASHHATILPSHSPVNQISSESSPSCSEYSSPPPSPPPSESPRQQNSERTSSEESLHDKGGSSIKSEGDVIQGSEDKHCCSSKQSGVKTDESQWNKDNWPILAATPPPLSYAPNVTHMHPHVQKPNHLPVHSKTSPAPLGTSTVIFENGQYTNLPSALSFLSHSNIQRSHSSTPERALPVSTVVTVPVTTVCPFPVVTSGCTTPTSCMTTYRNSGTATVTTAASFCNSRQPCSKNLSIGRENDGNHKLHQQSDVISAHYTLTPAYLLPPSAVSAHPSQPATCTGVCTVTSSIVASSVLSSPSTPGTPQQTHHTVSLPFNCVGFLPHIFQQTFPFIQTHGSSPANGLISPAMTPPPSVHSFPFPIAANSIPPELMYARQSFPIPPPSPNPNSVPSNPTASPVPAASSPGSATYSSVNASYSKPAQSNGNTSNGKVSCFNCGKFGHRGSDCKDASLNDGQFQLTYAPGSRLDTPTQEDAWNNVIGATSQ